MILLCSFILVGHLYSQEVIVARETKPEAPKQTPPPEQAPAESATPEPERTKPKSRKKSASAEPTLEQMRRAVVLPRSFLVRVQGDQQLLEGKLPLELFIDH